MIDPELLHAAREQDRRLQVERRRRHNALDIHALKAIFIGPLILIGGAPGNIEARLGIWVRPGLAYLALLAGFFLFVGPRLYRDPHVKGKLEALGLVMVGLWDLFFVVALIWTIGQWEQPWVLCWPWELKDIPTTQPRLFAPVIFLALLVMTWWLHLRAVLDDRRKALGR